MTSRPKFCSNCGETRLEMIMIMIMNFLMENIQPTYSNYLKNPMKTEMEKKENYYIVLHRVKI